MGDRTSAEKDCDDPKDERNQEQKEGNNKFKFDFIHNLNLLELLLEGFPSRHYYYNTLLTICQGFFKIFWWSGWDSNPPPQLGSANLIAVVIRSVS